MAYRALSINVLALRQSQTPFEIEGIEAAQDIHELFARSNHLVLAAPLTDASRHIVDSAVLASAKPGLDLINIDRGGLLDNDGCWKRWTADALALHRWTSPSPSPCRMVIRSTPIRGCTCHPI